MGGFPLAHEPGRPPLPPRPGVGPVLSLVFAGLAALAGIALAMRLTVEGGVLSTRPLPEVTLEIPSVAPVTAPGEGGPSLVELVPSPPATAQPPLVRLAASEPAAPPELVVPSATVGAPAATPPERPVAPAPSVPANPAPVAAVTLPPPERTSFYLPAVPAGPITGLEKRLLDALNAERANAGLPPLVYDAGLSRIARIRTHQLLDQAYFDHVDPYGYTMYTELLNRFGYGSFSWAGENLALNNALPIDSPERAVASLMRSPSHRDNILFTGFARVGVGELATPDGRHYYVIIFYG